MDFHIVEVTTPPTKSRIPPTKGRPDRISLLFLERHKITSRDRQGAYIPKRYSTMVHFLFLEEDVENFDVTNLSQDVLQSIEADSFWCMSKLLDGIQVGHLSVLTLRSPGNLFLG